MLAISGDMPRKMHGTDFIQTTEPDLLFRDVSLYTETISSPAQAPAVIHQAIAAAYAGRGVAHLTIPQDVFEAKADGAVLQRRHLEAAARNRPRARPTSPKSPAASMRRTASSSCAAPDATAPPRNCARSRTGSRRRSIHSVKGKDIMPYDDPRWMGGVGMIGTKAVYNAIMHCDLFADAWHRLSLFGISPAQGRRHPGRRPGAGARSPRADGARRRRFGAADLETCSSTGSQAKSDGKFFDRVTGSARQVGCDAGQASRSRRAAWHRIHPQAVARAVSDLAKPDAIFVFDTGLNTLWSANWIRQSGSQRIIGSFNNAAVGTALGQANGIQALDRSRQVIALCGDGGFNMLMCEFLTAVHHKLPVKVIVYNNSSFGLIHAGSGSDGPAGLPERASSFPIRISAALARACGGHGF